MNLMAHSRAIEGESNLGEERSTAISRSLAVQARPSFNPSASL
jgi:hypothetical protein